MKPTKKSSASGKTTTAKPSTSAATSGNTKSMSSNSGKLLKPNHSNLDFVLDPHSGTLLLVRKCRSR